MANNLVNCILIAVILVGYLSASSSKDGEKGKVRGKFGKWATLSPITSTTPSPLTPESLCEMKYDKSNNSVLTAIKEGINYLTGQYNNWGKLLAPAPVAIGILGQLILMANQKMDFPINSEDPQRVYKHIEYPNSFRTTLLQISQRGHRAFLKAHINMEAIRNLNRAVPGDIKDAVRYLISVNVKVIKLRLPATIKKIKEAAKRSQDLSKEVVNEFTLTLSLIEETELAVSSKKSYEEGRLKDVILDIKLEKQAKESSEKEESILKEKNSKMKAIIENLEYRKGHFYSRTKYNNIDFTINLAKDNLESEIVKEIGYEQYNKDKNFLNDKSKKWRYTYFNRFVKNNPCIKKNSQHLLDLLIFFGEYRERYEHWQNSDHQHNLIFDGRKCISDIGDAITNIQQCPEVDNIITKGSDLMNKLKNSTIFQSKVKTSKRPCSNEIADIVVLINNLRNTASDVTVQSGKQEEVIMNSAMDIYRKSKQHQLDLFTNMTKTIEDIIKLNNDLTEIRKQKTQRIMDRIISLDINKVHIDEVFRALASGLAELNKLKENWEKLIMFFKNIQSFIEIASRHSNGLVEILQTLSTNTNRITKEQMLFDDLINNVENSNEAVLLVHGIADMYTKVSDRYIMGRVARLNTMNSMMIDGVTDQQLQQEKEKLSNDTKQASEDIEKYFQHQSNQLNKTLKTRHQEIFTEYQQLFVCIKGNGIINQAVNFSDQYRFQLKSRMNGKVLEVSSGNNSAVRMWNSHGKDNQLWYLDQDKIIRSFATNGCLTSHDNPKRINIEPCKNTVKQKWMLNDKTIVNVADPTRCLHVHESAGKQNSTRLVECNCHRSAYQLWDIKYQQLFT